MGFSKDESEAPLPRYVRARDLINSGIVGSYTALDRLIRNHQFPLGILLSPNTRAWTVEEIETWLATRPTARKRGPARKREAEAA
jgi:predicted DNA-binding transcriptional regulator AlpA